MDDELRTRLDALDAKVEATRVAAEKTRTYLIWTGIITLALIIAPTIALMFMVPSLVATYSQPYEML